MSTTSVPTGMELLHNASLNKGTAFTEDEREALGLRGLLPPHVHTMEEQVTRVMENYRRKDTPLGRYIHLLSLQDRNETLFHRVCLDHLEEMMPVIYTPTVGQACQEYGHIFRRTRGCFVSLKHRGRVADVLRNWPYVDVRVIVVTDGERILGLGDLGADGMGIPIGKLSLYSVCAGVHPSDCLPIMLDVGTDNEQLLNDPLYIGTKQRRLRGQAYDDFVDEFITAATEVFPRALVQFEDFANANAFRLLDRYRDRICTFNDDIQGTGSVVLAGILGALRITGGALGDQRFLFLGAGEAGLGCGKQIAAAMVLEGMSEKEARDRFSFFDIGGLVVKSRKDLSDEHRLYAHDHPHTTDFLEAVKAIKPTVIVGASAQAGAFGKDVLETMASLNDRPIVFALSNPTAKAECTPEDAYKHTAGRAVYASGSPFKPLEVGGKKFVPGQANNAYVFPGIGLGVVAVEATRVTDEMFYASAKALADMVSDKDLAMGRVFPGLAQIREISLNIAVAVAEVAYEQGLARIDRPADLKGYIRSQMFEPVYDTYV
ncbi:MAG: NAD-dependent malic enzyme [Candidatus Eisenbacteria bacterium]|nr:NAD-dependent malic enzyme [Candidatus Eisenbacteria bacterium]